jgi:hypothetical protein
MSVLLQILAVAPAEIASVAPGIHGTIIAVLMSVVGILSGVIVWMQRRADKIYGFRLAERDTANEALNAAAAAQQAQAAASRERNELQEELAETIQALTASITLFIERSTIQHTHMTADQEKQAKVIESISEAMRNVALQSTGMKDRLDSISTNIPALGADVKGHIDRLIREHDLPNNRRSR